MGEVRSMEPWKNDRIFTGLAVGYPVELFIELIEREANEADNKDSQMCDSAWNHILSDDSPAGIWKIGMESRRRDMNWTDLKSALWEAFGRKEPYRLDQRFELVQSLLKGESELFTMFLYRVEWVLKTIGNYGNSPDLTQIFFLLGLTESDQMFILDKLKNCVKKSEDDLKSIVSLLDETVVPPLEMKQEPVEMEYVPDTAFYYDDYGDGLDEEKPLRAKKKVSKKRKAVFSNNYSDYEEENDQDEDFKPGVGKKAKKVGKVKDPKLARNFHCQQCNKKFGLNRSLNSHIKQNHKVKCLDCSETFEWDDDTSWDEHAQVHYAESGGECPLCPLKIDDFASMKAHQIAIHGGKQTKCKMCSHPVLLKEFDHKCKLAPGKHQFKSIGSAMSDETIRARANLRIYHLAKGEDPRSVKTMAGTLVAVEDNVATYYCAFCLRDFAEESELKAHQDATHNGYKFQCELCYEFKSVKLTACAQHKLMKHDVVVETYKRYDCPAEGCRVKSIDEWQYNYHYKLAHSKEFEEATTCKICGKRFGSHKDHLRNHIEAVHMNDKPWKCSHCPKTYTYKSELTHHVAKKHTGESPKTFSCPICGKTFRNDSTVKLHIAAKHPVEGAQYLPAHQRNQRYECEHCGKIFTEKSTFTHHVNQAHMDDSKKIQCPRCDFKVKKAQGLRQHFMKAHLNIALKPFSCTICGNSYVRFMDCWVHVANKHESTKDWKPLSLQKPELVEKIDVPKAEREALKDHLEEKFLPSESHVLRFSEKWKKAEN